MKTFTTYAEKKAKQILNLLQGYTKGIRITAILLLLLMGVSNAWAATITGGTTLYLKPNSNWLTDGARFAAYLFNGTSGAEWYSMSDCNGDGIYEMKVNSGKSHKNVIFCRMNPGNSTNDWNQRWNQTGDLTWDDSKNLYTIKNGSWDAGSWSVPTFTDKVVYFKPFSGWKADNAEFMAYAFDNCSNYEWKEMTEIGCAGEYYTCTIPAKYNKVIIARMNPSRSTNNFNSDVCWNKTGDLTIPTDSKNLFTLANDAWNDATATWGTYTASTYSITTNAGTGGTITVSKSSSIALNEQVDVTISTSEGYTYKSGTITIGTNAAKSISEGKSTHTICGTTTINAQWTANKYTVTLNNQGATTAGTASVQATFDAAMPSATMPTKTGYTFGGYYTSNNGGGTQYYNANGASAKNWNIASNSTLYAKWTANQYTITYKDQGNVAFSGTHASTPPTTHTYGVETTLKTASKTGYTFEGWHTDESCTNKVTSLGATAYTANITLYAKWTANQYTITYKDQNNADFSGTHASGYPTTHTYGTATTLKDATKTGYTFDGWFTTSACIGTAVNSLGATDYTSNITLYAKWTEQAQPEPAHEIYLVGEFNWDAALENLFTKDSNNPNIYTLTKKFDARDRHQTTTQSQPEYEFKLQVDGVKYTVEDNTDPNTKEKYKKILQYTRQSKTKKLSDGTAYDSDPYYNLLLQADFTGYYVFTYNVSTQELTVEHPTYTPEASYIVGDFSDGATGTDALPKDRGAGHDWTEAYGQKIGTDPNNPICFELGKNSTWEFKIKINGVWYGAENVNITEDGEYILTDDYAYMSERNCTITTTDADGEYCFSYKVNDDGTITLIVGYPEEDEVEEANTVYLKLNNEWKKDNARFAVYYWNDGGNTWKDMEAIDCNGDYYKAEVPEGYSKLIFVRMKSNTTNDWNNKDGIQSPDLTLPTDGKNLCDVEKAKYLYLTPNSKWKEQGARFAAYFFGNGEKWVDMKDDDEDGIYTCEKQSGFPQVIFCRMNPGTTENKWDNKWNQTGDQWIQGDGKDHFILTAGSWDQGTWAHYSWSTYTAPTYDVTINITGKGSIVIDGQTYTSNSTGTTTQKKTGVKVNTNINVTSIEPADRWAKSAATIKIANNDQEELSTSHSICGPTTINVTFEQTKFVVHFELQLPENTEHPEIDDQIVDKNTTAAKPQVNNIEGHIFGGWYTDAACSIGKEYDFNTPVTKDITLYAKWIPYGDCVFFKNNLNWDEIYVYFYSSNKYWNDSKGTGSEKEKEIDGSKAHYREFRGEMTQLGKTDIWYFDYISAAKRINPTYWEEIKASTNIAFTAHEQYNYEFFDNTKVIRRGDFNRDMQLFIPQTDQTPTYLNKHDGISTRYYNKGLWMKYNSTESGYDWRGATSEDPNNGQWNTGYHFTADKAGGYSFTTTVNINSTNRHYFKVNNLNNTWYGHTDIMTQDNCTKWWFKEDVSDNAKIDPTITGEYVFTVFLGEGKVEISLEYPLSVGDYRLAYKDNQPGSFHPGHYIKKRNTSKNDTVSFFIHHHDNEPQVIAQRCTAIDNNGNAKWETITAINPAASITETGVYNFTLQQIEGQNDPLLLNQARPYIGNYYIRTDAAPGGWKSFRQEGNMMTYNSYADNNEDFDHYFCEWVSQEKGLKNVKYTVANDYSYCISDTLSNDTDQEHPEIVTNVDGDLPSQNGNLINANVRWGWDSKTNKIRRAYIAGSGHKKDRFLVLEGNESLLDVNGKRFTGNTAEGQDRYNLKDDEVVFDDMGNWIYQIDVKANKDTEIDLTALYNGKTQYFKGGDQKGEKLIVTTDDNTNYYKMRLIYDFKINKLIIAWLPEDEVDNQELEVNMMIIRHNQEKAQQVNFKQGAKLSGIETAYAVMTFDKYFLNNKDSKTGAALPQANEKSENERKFYWVSFPFDVKLSDVFGFGEYGDYWIMEYYDGAGRAEQGYWAETETFWKYITNKNYILKAGQGYVLYLNLNKMKFESNVFAHTSEVSLYFPSLSLPNVISGDLPTAVDVPEHTCTIERDNRNIYDSNWNLIGVPGFADISDVTIGDTHHKELNADCVSFYYKYLPGTNTYSATTQTETFQTMYAYMVQFAGTINWQAKTMPAQLAARRTGSTPSQYDLRLELAQGEETDQTFVLLKEADATADFDMNVDMTKIFNSGMNIYTLTGSNAIQVAGNAIPMGKATVPVGVRVDAAGEYTFRMPDGTDGIAVTLVDNATGTHTNMLMSEYTVTLNAGTIENRFYLVVDPDRTATSVENIGEEAKGDKAKDVEKFLIDGKLFIRTADGIFDAKGQRM